jgi:Holliday junction resolvase RusA-like endonuclease
MFLDIKPLSVNQAWQGKRFKTPAYKKYQADILSILRPLDVPKGYIELSLVFGFSSKCADFDNPVKPFVDCLQKKYGFNDNKVKRCTIEVKHVKKGKEFIEFEIIPINEG